MSKLLCQPETVVIEVLPRHPHDILPAHPADACSAPGHTLPSQPMRESIDHRCAPTRDRLHRPRCISLEGEFGCLEGGLAEEALLEFVDLLQTALLRLLA